MSHNHQFTHLKNATDDERIIANLRFCALFLRHKAEGKGSQRRVLGFLHERGPMTQQQILEEMGVRASSLSELLGKLEAAGLVTKEKSESDKRNYNVSISPEGIAALEQMQRQYDEMVSEMFSVLEKEEKTQLAGLLDKLHTLWEEKFDAPLPLHGHGVRED